MNERRHGDCLHILVLGLIFPKVMRHLSSGSPEPYGETYYLHTL